MNIAIGKSGRSCYFNKKRWSIHAGDDTPLILYKTLCELYPQHTFYMIGASDYQKCRKEGIKMPDNFVDLLGEFKIAYKDNYKKIVEEQNVWRYFVKYIHEHNIKLDFGIILQGPDMNVSLSNVGIRQRRDPNVEIKVMCLAANYIAPIVGVIDVFKIPWIGVNEDIRYVPINNRDITMDEECILSQSNEEKIVDRIEGFYEKSVNYRKHKIIYKYAELERMFLKDLKKVDFSNPDDINVNGEHYKKDNKFIITVNDGGNRLELIEKWVLNQSPKEKVYGRWSEESIAKHPDTFIATKISDMEPLMWRSKFTFVPAWEKKHTNFVTQKLWKMMYYGIIPFFDVNGYDTDRYVNVPEYCRVSSPEEMWQRINELDNDKEKYKKILNEIYALLEDKYFNEEFIKETFGPYIEKYAEKKSNG